TSITDGEGNYRFADVADGAWTVDIGMQLFASQKREISTPEAAQWDLELLPQEELAKAATLAPPTESLVVAPAKPVAAAPPKPANAKNAPTQTNTNTPSQRTGLAASATSGDAPQAEAPAGQDAAELRQRAADGLLVNGSVNNGAASPFAQLQAF